MGVVTIDDVVGEELRSIIGNRKQPDDVFPFFLDQEAGFIDWHDLVDFVF